MMRNISAYVFVVAASLAGCAPTGDVEYAGEVHVTSPELVTISPGVQVVADADEPLFYSDGAYWLYRDNGWYRSDSYRGGFARVEYTYLPQRIRVIEQPQTYVQYRRHGEGRYARDRQMQTRSQQSPTYTQPQQVQQQPQPTYSQPQAPATSVPSQPDTYRPGDAHPTPRPEGINPNTPPSASTQPSHPTTTPPAVVTPNNPSTPAPGDQRFQQPIDRANPPTRSPIGNPGPGIRPDDRTDPHAPGRIAPPGNDGTTTGNPNAPGHDKNGAPNDHKNVSPPGNTGYAPGNSGNAPGQNKNVSAPGNNANAPGNSANAPGQNKNVSAPGNTGNAPGNTGNAPANTGNAPGNTGNAPGNTGNAPGNTGNAPGNSANAPGQNKNVSSPDNRGNSANAPGQNKNVSSPDNRGNSAPPVRPDDRRPDDGNAPGPDHDMNGNGHGNGNGNVAQPGNNGNAPAQGREDKSTNHGNPSAPSRVAPTAPTNSPASPNAGAVKDADKDKHEHATPPGQAEKNDRKNDQKNDKKKNEKY